MHGKEDKIIPLKDGTHFSEAFQNLVDFIIIPNASHQVFEENPFVIGEEIIHFIFKIKAVEG